MRLESPESVSQLDGAYTVEHSGFIERVDTARHRGMKNALYALRPGMLICDPSSFEIRYANAAARTVLGLEESPLPCRLPAQLTISRIEDSTLAARKSVAFFRAELDGDASDVRVVPVYSNSGDVQSLLIMMRDYEGISWSLFEMLDKLPIAVAALSDDGNDIRYINRTAVREIFAGRAGIRPRRTRSSGVVDQVMAFWMKTMPDGGEGKAPVPAGRLKIDLNFSRLTSEEGETARLIYWDARVQDLIKN